MPKPKLIDEALKPLPAAERKVYHDWYDDGLKILDLLLSDKPEHQAAIAQLNKDCPYDYSIDIRTGKQIPTTAHTVAAWAGKRPEIVHQLRTRNLL